MKTSNTPRVRRSLQELQADYDKGTKKPLEDLMRAWQGIKALPPDDPNSFFMLGGYHGAPFRGAGWGTSSYWGGYCNHGNVLFPTWHRMYLFKLEQALQSIPGCEDVMLPYWDETAEDTLTRGIPRALTDKHFELDGKRIDNPLRSFVFPRDITDNINGDDPNYTKPEGYETKRYPLSGLVGTQTDQAATAKHNAPYLDADGAPNSEAVKLLNQNVVNWLTTTSMVSDVGASFPTHVAQKFKDCLEAPNYTVFSNTTSAQQWNDDHADAPVVPLESPHNSIHLAVGGCEVPGYDRDPIQGANGDMGENDTAGLDPIFYFHHCNIDRVFWLWQKKHGSTDDLELIAGYPGTNSVDSQGPTPGTAPNSWLTLDSPLDPFTNPSTGRPYTSRECIHIEKQLGYTYSPGSLEDSVHVQAEQLKQQPGRSSRVLRVTGVNRAPIRGSFTISAFAKIGDETHHLGTEAVLSRWSVQSCMNCQTHLEVKAFFPLHHFDDRRLAGATYVVKIHGRDGKLAQGMQHADGTQVSEGTHVRALAAVGKKAFRLEVR